MKTLKARVVTRVSLLAKRLGKYAIVILNLNQAIVILFGSETKGLPQKTLANLPDEQTIYLPMKPNNRSLNLSNSVAIVLFEAWRQLGFSYPS